MTTKPMIEIKEKSYECGACGQTVHCSLCDTCSTECENSSTGHEGRQVHKCMNYVSDGRNRTPHGCKLIVDSLVAQKGKAFDRLEERIKTFSRRTNIPERKAAYQQVLDAFTKEQIQMGFYDRCSICLAHLDWEIAKWAYRKGIHWFCGGHYQTEEKSNPIIKKHRRSFKLLVTRLEKEGKLLVPVLKTKGSKHIVKMEKENKQYG